MFRVLPSFIQGHGLFAQQPLPARRKLGEFTGEKISVREARRRAKDAQRIVIVEISETEAIDGSVGECPFQFVNHSCDPNVFIRVAHRRVEFYARRNIGPAKSSPATTATRITKASSPAAAARPTAESLSELLLLVASDELT